MSTPKCPKCDKLMVRRHSSYGDFWGCSQYPKCKATVDIKNSNGGDDEQPEWKAKAAARAAKASANSKPEVKYDPIEIMSGSDEQEAVWHELLKGKRHVVVEAVAGSGKTWTMIQACLRMPKTKSIAFIAFNKHIAEEAQGKLRASGCGNVTACTSHSLGLGIIRQTFPNTKIEEHKTDEILRGHKNPLPMDLLTRDRDWRGVCSLTRKLVGYAKNYMLDDTTPDLQQRLEKLCEHHAVDTTSAAQYAYLAFDLVPKVLQESKARAQFMVDFDDMIWLPVVLGLRPSATYDLLIVDEAQDTNVCQQELIMRVVGKGRVAVVGDRFQSIYGFRAADVTAIPNLIARLEQTSRGVVICPLTVTRRCPQTPVTLAQAIVPQIRALDTAPMGEIESMSLEKAEAQMRPGHLVLCRCNAPLVPTAYRLIRSGVKAVIRGRDIGKGLLDLVTRLEASDLRDLAARLADYRAIEVSKLSLLGDKAESRIAALTDKCDCLVEMIAGATALEDLRANIESLFSDFDADGTPKHAVVLGTVHRTKGLEGETVFVLEPEKIPHPMARQAWEQEQERNLAYVAVTRVKYTDATPGRLVFCGSIPAIYYGPVAQSAEQAAHNEGEGSTPSGSTDSEEAAGIKLTVNIALETEGYRVTVEPDLALGVLCRSESDAAMEVARAVQRALDTLRMERYWTSRPEDFEWIEGNEDEVVLDGDREANEGEVRG